MRTTLTMDDHVLARAKSRARQRGQTLGQFVEQALQHEFSRQPITQERPTIPVFTAGTGPRPGVDLSSNRSLWEILDEGDRSEH